MGITFLFRMISKLLDKLDGLWMTLGGFTVDLDRIEELRKRRRFSHEGLLRFGLSYAPWSDRELKSIAGKYGGWQHITRLEYEPSEDLLVELENAGVSRTEFEHTRTFLADEIGYQFAALFKHWKTRRPERRTEKQ